jgi:peptide deformylase
MLNLSFQRPDDPEGELVSEQGALEILLVGDPRLRQICDAVPDFEDPEFRRSGRQLIAALERFRSEYGFGRAIAAPQLGIPLRMIAMNLGEGAFLIVNPRISGESQERFTLWDDCMSFPWLMVRLERHAHLDLEFFTEKGERQMWRRTDRAVSELLQHEVDHLNGVLALDRAMDRESIVARRVYEARREHFDRQVDYTIVPTIRGSGAP